MKIIKAYFKIIILFFLIVSCKTTEDIRQYAAIEIYPQDSILNSVQIKKAMIVIAHDDDMCAMSGTISQLNKKGWEIAVVSFSRSEDQNSAHIKACRNILDTVIFVELKPHEYRNDLDKGYHPIPKSAYDTVFNHSIIIEKYLEKIIVFNPTVIFSLDNEVGAYGHPDHVFISQMVIDLVAHNKISPSYIYQSVFTDHMMNQVMKRRSNLMISWGYAGDNWEIAKNTYNVKGMPEPNVQINIVNEAKNKMNYLRSYNKKEKKSIDFFMPEFEKHNSEKYFEILDREFFKIIQISDQYLE